jgi:hypothetical protein
MARAAGDKVNLVFNVMTVQEAVENFRAAAMAKGNFADAISDIEFHNKMKQSVLFLKQQGEVGNSAFKHLLRDENKHVRVWVAAQLLS